MRQAGAPDAGGRTLRWDWLAHRAYQRVRSLGLEFEPSQRGPTRGELTAWPKFDPSQPLPLYHQVYLAIADKIHRGELPAGKQLPSENALAKQFNISRITVKRAMQELVAHNLVLRARGRGTVVAEREPPLVQGKSDGLTDWAKDQGLSTKLDLLESIEVEAPPEVTARLQIAEGTQVRRNKWRRRIEGHPFSYFTTYIAVALSAQFAVHESEALPFAVILKENSQGPLTTEQWISAVQAEAEAAMVLAIDIGHPVIRVDRLLRDHSGKPVQYLVGYYCTNDFDWYICSREPFVGTLAKKDA